MSDRDGDFEIFVMNGDGTEVRQLTDGDKEVVAEFPHPECLFRGEKCPFRGSFQMSAVPVWSPDGRQIAFLQMNLEGDWEAISVMNADGSDYRPLLGVSLKRVGPVWSPDGRQIAVVVTNGIVLINTDGSGWTEIGASSGWGYGDASWSPDGKQIVWYGFGAPEDDWGLHVASTDGSNMRALIVDEPTESEWSSDGDPAWSPDGRHIAFYGKRGEVFVVSPDGSDVRQLNDTSSRATAVNDVAPVWSPDGMEIAYTRKTGSGGSLLINVVSADGSEVRELTDREIWPTRWHGGDCEVPQDWSDEMGDFSPVWSPDGTQIVFSSDRDCDLELFVMNADGSEGRQLTYNDTHDVFPSWTR